MESNFMCKDSDLKIKEYMSKTYRIDQRIKSKIEQIRNLRELAEKVNSAFRDITGSGNQNKQKMECAIVKMLDLENEIKKEIEDLIDLKRKIISMIKKVKNFEYQMILELRYLHFKKWREIAAIMGYGVDNIYKMHKNALKKCSLP